MPAYYNKLWNGENLRSVANNRVGNALFQSGKALPCHVTAVNGSIVTVAFDVTSPYTLPTVTIPKAESTWLRSPTQVGDKGIVIAADAALEPISGMQSGTAALQPPGNLSGLLFVPVSQQPDPPQDSNAAYAQGPNGFVGQTTTGTTSSIVTNKNGTTITFGSVSMTISASGVHISGGNLTVDEDATIDGIQYSTHVHAGVTSGTSVTSTPQ